ncbi:MAG: Protocatechuate (dihdydroxy benzoate) 3,4-dioxygenase, beta subunit [Planctomycetota bacterium]
MYRSVSDERARSRLVSSFDWENTMPEYAIAYRFDMILRGRDATPMETKENKK